MKTIYKKLLFLLLLLPFSVLAQSTLSGTVVDKNSKQPIPGVNVVVQGAPNGVQTDFDGKFQLPAKKGDVIVFSYLGYKNFSVTYDAQTNLTVSLEEEANQLSEVVVQIGYGSVKKKDATGSVSLVTSKDFNKGTIVSADQLLAGKAPGVRITNSGGQPDAAPNIRIRGGASLTAASNPLIVIDGVPLANENPAGVSNPLTLINPNDIESFSILKDASATAIYGSRASNGVIIITTKKGTSGKPQFNYSANVSVGEVTDRIKVMDGPTFTRFVQQYHPEYTNLLGIDDPSTDVSDDLATPEVEGRILYDTDWQNQIFRTTISTDHNFSVRGNMYDKIPYRASIGYNRTEGVVKTSDYERFSYAFKMTPTFMEDHLKIDVNAKGTYTDKNAIDEGGSIGGALNMDPTKPVYDYSINNPANRFGGYYQNTKRDGNKLIIDGQSNPLAVLEQRDRPERALRFLGNIEFDYKTHFLPELRAVLNLGLDASRSRMVEKYSDFSAATYQFNNPDVNTNPDTNYLFNPGVNFVENQTTTNTLMDAYLAYDKALNGFVSRVALQGGYTYQNFRLDGNKEEYRYNATSGQRELDYDPNYPNNRYFNPYNLQSFFARGNIDLSNKYLITATMRADASSLFAEDRRWGYFPSAAIAWKIKEESFLKDVSFVSDLKLRLGWGKTGQQNIGGEVGYFPYRALFTINNNQSQYLPGNSYSALVFRENTTWEKTTTFNAGLDFEFTKDSRIAGSVDVYSRETTDLLAVVPLPPGQGLKDEFIDNIGSTKDHGVEANLTIIPVKTDNITWSVSANVAYNYGKVEELKGSTQAKGKDGGLPTGTNQQLVYNVVGEQPFSAWVFEQLYSADGNPIPNAFVDRNLDGKITNEDRYYKAMRPNWTYGFSTSFNYKNWDLTANFRGQIGGQMYNTKQLIGGYTDRVAPNNATSLNNALDFYAGDANPLFENFNGNAQYSDYFLEDATFLRCDNITLGYKFVKFIKSSSLRVYGSVNNAFLITDYSGQDPENFTGIDNNFYPRPRIYTFGLSLDF